jgi:hypothetical protein
MNYPKEVYYRRMWFRGYLHSKKGLVVYRTKAEYPSSYKKSRDTIGILPLGQKWQDGDRTWTSQDIYWEDKYDCKPVRLEAA